MPTNAGFLPPSAQRARAGRPTTENRGVPGSSPGLAISPDINVLVQTMSYGRREKVQRSVTAKLIWSWLVGKKSSARSVSRTWLGSAYRRLTGCRSRCVVVEPAAKAARALSHSWPLGVSQLCASVA
jgi:hypothetical protein